MAMQGNLQDMAVADLIQHNCQDHKTARLDIEHNGQQATLFFKEGGIQHATLGKEEGEEVIYEILAWQDGSFSLEMGEEPPAVTIERSWSGLLLEGARRLDEAALEESELLAEAPPEEETPKKKGDILVETLTELLEEASDIYGAAVVGIDGLIYSAHVPQKDLDENLVGATSAAVLGLSKRSVDQLKRGNFRQTLIQGKDGNIIVAGLNPETLFIGLTPEDVNLGMTFSEVRTMIERLNEVL